MYSGHTFVLAVKVGPITGSKAMWFGPFPFTKNGPNLILYHPKTMHDMYDFKTSTLITLSYQLLA